MAGERESVGPPAGPGASEAPTTTVAQRSSTSTVAAVAPPDFRPGAEANRSSWVEAFPVPVPTGQRVEVGSVTELNAAMGSVGPGDEIVLRAGTYEGEVNVSARGRAGSPITVRAAEPMAAVVVGDGSWNLSGEHLVLRDLRFDRTRGGTKGVVVVTGRHVRVTQNRFDAVGYTAEDTDTRSVIRMETDRDSFNLVDANEVDRPNTVFTYLSHGTGYTVYSHNVITGPNGMGGRYNSYLVKSGSAMDPRPSRTVFQYNTVLDWGLSIPEAIDEKTPGAVYVGNLMPDVVLYLRHGSGSTVVGNHLYSLHVDGADHRIEGNLLLADQPWVNEAVPVMTFTAAEAGSTRNEAARGNRVVGNVVVAGGRPGVSQFQERNVGIWGDLSAIGTLRDNEFRRNTFVRARPRAGADDGVGFVGFLGQPEAQRSLVATNSFVDNRFACDDCGTALSAFVGRDGNRLDTTVSLRTLPTPSPVEAGRPRFASGSIRRSGGGDLTVSWAAVDAWYVVVGPGGHRGVEGTAALDGTALPAGAPVTLRALGPGGWTTVLVDVDGP